MKKPLIDNRYLLQKFPGKGGWTYAAIPEILQDKSNPFGWVKVTGTIDGFDPGKIKLMPMGDERIFFPVKASIRKAIGKKEGDWVHIVLFADDRPLEVPEEIILCLKEEPETYNRFMQLTDGEKQAYLDWVYSARQEQTRVDRIAKMMGRLANGLKFYDKD